MATEEDSLKYGTFLLAGTMRVGHFTSKLAMYQAKDGWRVIHMPTRLKILTLKTFFEARSFLRAIQDLDWDFEWIEKARMNLPEVEKRLKRLMPKWEAQKQQRALKKFLNPSQRQILKLGREAALERDKQQRSGGKPALVFPVRRYGEARTERED